MKAITLVILIGALTTLSNGSELSSILENDPLTREWLQDQKRTHEGKSDTFVTIQNGTIKGTTYYAVGGEVIYAYLGIPFAQPPLGPLRFQPPQPLVDGWGEEIFDGTKHPNACPQYLTNLTLASEDCLFISVYTKRTNTSTEEPLPVMYWIHGGGFLLGQTSYYTASKLLANDVVYVSVQYRMGPFGFLSTGDQVVPGNMGMKDMVQGLRWVKENIAAFGGDPTKVTVFGESAGGAAATFMLLSPLAHGLYSRVAAMSGTALAEWSMDTNPRESTLRLATALNCTDTTTSEKIHECLMGRPWEEISKTHFNMLFSSIAGELRALLPGTSPVVEPPGTPGAFLPDEPLKLLEEGVLPDVPVMLGANQHEGSFLLGVAHVLELGPSGVLDDPVYVHDHLVGDLLATWGVYEDKNGASISQGLSTGFIPQPRNNFTEMAYGLMDLLSVLFMKAPVLRTAEILSRRLPTSSVYLYSFEYSSRNSLWTLVTSVVLPIIGGEYPPFKGGTTHGDDLISMFTFPFVPTTADQALSKTYCKLFTNFATTGSPASADTEEYPAWPKFSVLDPKYMVIDSPPNVQTDYTLSWRKGIIHP